MRCPHCATFVRDDSAALCPHCGHSLSGAERTRRRRAQRRQELSPEIPPREAAPARRTPAPQRREEQTRQREAYRGEIAPAYAGQEGPIRVRRPPNHQEDEVLLSGKRISLQKRTTNWAVVMLLIFIFLVAVVITAIILLTQTDMGQIQMAAWGYEVDVKTKWKLGEMRKREGYITQALEIFEEAYEEDTKNVEGAMLLGATYEQDGQEERAIELYTQVLKDVPDYPEAYNRMIRIYRDEQDHQSAIEMMELALEKTGSPEFSTLIKEYMPDAPFADPIGGRFIEDTDVVLNSVGDVEIYYTLDGSDPLTDGTLYEEPIHLVDGQRYELRAVSVQQNGIPSYELNDTYTIAVPAPDAPKATVASGTYDKSRKVGLRAADNVVAIYYTTDDTPPTTDSQLYTEPIQLPVGNTTLRAIAIDDRGKPSYEMIVGYKIKGNVKKAFNAEDTVGKFSLMKTTYEQFVKAQGEPGSYQPIDSPKEGDLCFEAQYSFGVARFVQQAGDDKQVLYEMEIRTGELTGPRKSTVGMEMVDAIALFRDRARTGNAEGERLLYDDGDDVLGVLTREAGGNFAAHYYYPRGKNDYAELSLYFSADDLLERIVWLRYEGIAEPEAE